SEMKRPGINAGPFLASRPNGHFAQRESERGECMFTTGGLPVAVPYVGVAPEDDLESRCLHPGSMHGLHFLSRGAGAGQERLQSSRYRDNKGRDVAVADVVNSIRVVCLVLADAVMPPADLELPVQPGLVV